VISREKKQTYEQKQVKDPKTANFEGELSKRWTAPRNENIEDRPLLEKTVVQKARRTACQGKTETDAAIKKKRKSI